MCLSEEEKCDSITLHTCWSEHHSGILDHADHAILYGWHSKEKGEYVAGTLQSVTQHWTAFACTVKIIVIVGLDYSRSTSILPLGTSILYTVLLR